MAGEGVPLTPRLSLGQAGLGNKGRPEGLQKPEGGHFHVEQVLI